jgi:hypothetical protein
MKIHPEKQLEAAPSPAPTKPAPEKIKKPVASEKAAKVEEVLPPEPPPYAGPVVVLFENPAQVQHLNELLHQPQMLSGIEVTLRARVMECIFQGVPLKDFSDKIINSYLTALKKQKDEEMVRQQQADYEKALNPDAKPVIANTPTTILKGVKR